MARKASYPKFKKIVKPAKVEAKIVKMPKIKTKSYKWK